VRAMCRRSQRDQTGSESKHREYYRQVVGSRIAAVSASATPRIQNARSRHPKESKNPNYGPQRYSGENGHKNCKLWQPPREKACVSAVEPIVGLFFCFDHIHKPPIWNTPFVELRSSNLAWMMM
jgi:hypothetical protein